MPYLTISSIVCEVPEESDKDEIFLIQKGRKIWPKDKRYLKIDVDETLPVGLKLKINKPGKLKLELWDFDLASKNDLLGVFELEITSLEAGGYTDLLLRNEPDAKKASYFLNWEIST